jgi:hypothetical protein
MMKSTIGPQPAVSGASHVPTALAEGDLYTASLWDTRQVLDQRFKTSCVTQTGRSSCVWQCYPTTAISDNPLQTACCIFGWRTWQPI